MIRSKTNEKRKTAKKMSGTGFFMNDMRKQDKKMHKLLRMFDEAVDFEEIRRLFECFVKNQYADLRLEKRISEAEHSHGLNETLLWIRNKDVEQARVS